MAYREELGNKTWFLLHSLAANFPSEPSPERSQQADQFVRLLGELYPCPDCAEHFRELLDKSPPRTESREEFSQWMCEIHNEVNRSIGKPEFPCSRSDEQWQTKTTVDDILDWEF